VTRSLKSCVICGGHDIDVRWGDDRRAVVSCNLCRRVTRIEFDPPDQPELRGRIEMVFDPHAPGGPDEDVH
jgi:hypothetical protein